LKEKKYKLGFVASGDHNNMGIGVAALWVKEISRKGIIEALRARRTFATTGDKMYIDIEINGAAIGSNAQTTKAPKISIDVVGQYPLEKVELIRNSKVIHTYNIVGENSEFNELFVDKDYQEEEEVLYYYVRGTQKNNALAWSSPIWIENV
jgi:hypothetical protein